jgi:predicted nuclease of predicted toxin-antitoxin system
VKLLFDENLSPQLIGLLSDLYPESTHVDQCGLGGNNDTAIWEYAKANGFTIVSKDSDFEERSILLGAPPKFIWVRVHNCTTAAIEGLCGLRFRG